MAGEKAGWDPRGVKRRGGRLGWRLGRASRGAPGKGGVGTIPAGKRGLHEDCGGPGVPPGQDRRGSPFASCFPGTGCSGMLHRAGMQPPPVWGASRGWH